MKTLPTIYNGVKFRSRTEARWAIFFDAMGIEWAYENEGYQLSTGEMYLPDFYFPRGFAEFAYAEVKPIINALDERAFEHKLPTFERSDKFYQFSRECDNPVILLDGWPDLVPYYSLESANGTDGSQVEGLMDYIICGGDGNYIGSGDNCGSYVCSGMTRKEIREQYRGFWDDTYILPVITAQTYSFQ